MSDLLARLIAAGTPADLVAEVAMLTARAAVDREAIETRRASDRTRSTRRRHVTSRDVTGDSVTARDVTDEAPPAPAPSFPPDPQTNPTPTHPGIISTPTCEAHEAAAPAKRKARWPKAFPPPPGVGADAWAGFVEHRAAKRQSLTPRAYELLTRKLAELADAGWPPGEMIDRAVERGWITVFPPDETRNGHHRPHHDRSRSPGLLGAVLDAERDDRARQGL